MTHPVLGRVVAAVACATLVGVAVATEAAKYTVDQSNYAIPESLTGKAGDADNGRQVVVDRKSGNCLACHTMPIPEQPFHGRLAPPLMGVGARYTPAQLRLRVVNEAMRSVARSLTAEDITSLAAYLEQAAPR